MNLTATMHDPATGAPEPPGPALPGFEVINRYWDRTQNAYAAKLLPGEFYVTRHNEWITTVLGSCISACVRDAAAGVGGMNHFMLPKDDGGGGWSRDPGLALSARYGSYAMEQLINEILKHGGRRERLEAKVFGGGRVLAQMTDVGRRNIEFVTAYLEAEGVPVLARDVGDVYPRKVMYWPATGRVRLKKLRTLKNETIAQREEAYRRDIEQGPISGDVELF